MDKLNLKINGHTYLYLLISLQLSCRPVASTIRGGWVVLPNLRMIEHNMFDNSTVFFLIVWRVSLAF